jgi:hypothetical protein
MRRTSITEEKMALPAFGPTTMRIWRLCSLDAARDKLRCVPMNVIAPNVNPRDGKTNIVNEYTEIQRHYLLH